MHLRRPGDHRGGPRQPGRRLPNPRPARPPRPRPNRLQPRRREALGAGEVPLRAPMPGMIISYAVKVGDKVNTGDLVWCWRP